jgi:GPH family glycoside/pentoside/hexuronide:cation symporter
MLSLSTRLAYGAGGIVYAVKESAYTMFILLYYTQVLGLGGSVTGAIVALSLIWDAVSDPLVGSISDRLRSRHGRRHPFMAYSILPLGLGFIGLFTPPDSVAASQMQLAAWLLFWSLWVRTFVTTFCIPHLALSAEITSDYVQRSQVLGARLGLLFLFAVLLPALGLLLVFDERAGVDGRFVAANYPLYGALSCAVCWIAASITTFGTRRYAMDSRQRSRLPAGRGISSLFRDVAVTLGNRVFRRLVAYEIATSAAYGSIATLNMLVWTYYWEFSAGQVSAILAVPSLLAVGLVAVTLAPLGRRFDKNRLLQVSIVGLILNCLWLYPPKMLGWLPANGHPSLFVLNFLFMLIFMYCYLLRTIQGHSITADIADQHELDHGVRQEGGFFSTINFISKVASVFGPLYGGIVLDVVGLDTGQRPGEPAAETLAGLAYGYGIGVLPPLFIALFFALRIRMTRHDVQRVQASLDTRQPVPEQSA